MNNNSGEYLPEQDRRLGTEQDVMPIEQRVLKEFKSISEFLAEEYDFPELNNAQLIFVESNDSAGSSKLSKDVIPFYAKQYDSRSLKFEFDISRFNNFSRAFKDIFDDTELSNSSYNKIATMLYLGCGMVRPITEYEFFRKHAPLKAQHATTVQGVYSNRKDLIGFFEDMFGLDASGPMHAQLINEIPGNEIMSINTVRIALSFLYGGLRRDVDKVVLGELMRNSKNYLYNYVLSSRIEFQNIAVKGHGDEGVKKGDWLFLDTIPSWLLAFACPIKPESYGKLSEKFWNDKFSIHDTHDMKTVIDGLGSMCTEAEIVDIPVIWTQLGK